MSAPSDTIDELEERLDRLAEEVRSIKEGLVGCLRLLERVLEEREHVGD